jgi:hypothetical protein
MNRCGLIKLFPPTFLSFSPFSSFHHIGKSSSRIFSVSTASGANPPRTGANIGTSKISSATSANPEPIRLGLTGVGAKEIHERKTAPRRIASNSRHGITTYRGLSAREHAQAGSPFSIKTNFSLSFGIKFLNWSNVFINE